MLLRNNRAKKDSESFVGLRFANPTYANVGRCFFDPEKGVEIRLETMVNIRLDRIAGHLFN